MKIEQISAIVKDVYKQIIGNKVSDDVDTMTVVDMGKSILDSTDTENYLKTITDVIGKTVFINRPYVSKVPSVFMDSWEYGSVLRKIEVEIPDGDTVDNGSYPLTNGGSVSQDTIYLPSATVKLFNKKTTFEIDITIAERDVKSCFNSVNELNTFVSSIYSAVEKKFTVYLDSLIMQTINNFTANVLEHEFSTVTGATDMFGDKSSIKAVNLLLDYNTAFGLSGDTALTVEKALTDADFLKYASSVMNKYVDRLSKISELFNVGNKTRFTPKDDLKIVMLSDFNSNCASYLQADTFNKELVSLPQCDTVPYWQGSGTNYSFDSISKINVNIKDSGNATKNIVCSGILAVMFDKNAVAVCNSDNRVTTHYNAKGEYFNNFYKFDCSYLNDLNENFVVFFINDTVA